jgi:hypothetical protein
MSEIHYVNEVINDLISSKDRCFHLPRLPGGTLYVHSVMDASLASRIDQSSQGGRAVGICVPGSDRFSPVEVSSRKVRRRGSSSFDVELLTLVDTADMSYVVGLLLEEVMFSIRPSLVHRLYMELEGICTKSTKTRIVIDTDAKDSVERIYSLKNSIEVSKRRRVDISDLQEMLYYTDVTEFRHICGSTNPMDCLTKKYGRFGQSKQKACYKRFLELVYDGKYIADITAVERQSNLAARKIRYCGCDFCRF